MASLRLLYLFSSSLLVLQLLLSQCPQAVAGNKFLLVHGATQGAFAWWKTLADLEGKNHSASAVDMLSMGRDTTPTCDVDSIKTWSTNAITYLQALPPGEKVILVVHSLGGVVGQYLSENFPEKLQAVVYIASVVPPDNTTVRSVLGNGSGPGITHTPCDFRLDDFFWYHICQDCGDQYVKLLQLTARPQPTLFYNEPVHGTAAKFGSIRRFWVRTGRDQVVVPALQDFLISVVKPEKVYGIDSSHLPMMTKNRKLLRILLDVANKVG